jgi:hypothetical protein
LEFRIIYSIQYKYAFTIPFPSGNNSPRKIIKRGLMPEPYGYTVLLLIVIVQKIVPCGRMKNGIDLVRRRVMFVVAEEPVLSSLRSSIEFKLAPSNSHSTFKLNYIVIGGFPMFPGGWRVCI